MGKGGSGTITVDGTRSGESELQKRKLEYFLPMILPTWEPMMEPGWLTTDSSANFNGILGKVTVATKN